MGAPEGDITELSSLVLVSRQNFSFSPEPEEEEEEDVKSYPNNSALGDRQLDDLCDLIARLCFRAHSRA